MPSEMLQQMFEHAKEFAAREFNRRGTICPMFTGFGPGGIFPMLTPWRSDGEKRFYVAMVRQLFREHNVKGYTFMVEAWIAPVRPGDIIDGEYSDESAKPSQRADRVEVVWVFAEEIGYDKAIGGHWSIVRKKKKARVGVFTAFGDDANATGDLTGLLGEKVLSA